MRQTIATTLLNTARSIGETIGCELVVQARGDRLQLTMAKPDTETRVYDTDMWSSGGLYVYGYANPIKPYVVHSENPGEDEIRGFMADGDENEGGYNENKVWTFLKSSDLYRKTIRNDSLSQLLNPKERWTLLIYGMIALGVLQFVTMITILYATGTFQ